MEQHHQTLMCKHFISLLQDLVPCFITMQTTFIPKTLIGIWTAFTSIHPKTMYPLRFHLLTFPPINTPTTHLICPSPTYHFCKNQHEPTFPPYINIDKDTTTAPTLQSAQDSSASNSGQEIESLIKQSHLPKYRGDVSSNLDEFLFKLDAFLDRPSIKSVYTHRATELPTLTTRKLIQASLFVLVWQNHFSICPW